MPFRKNLCRGRRGGGRGGGAVGTVSAVVPDGQSDVDTRPSGRLTDHIGLGVLAARFHRDLLEEVINRTGCREKRSRRLPAHVMIRYVVAMGLFANESYEEVMRRLVGSLKRMGSWSDDWQVPTKSAITQARQRLGVAPL